MIIPDEIIAEEKELAGLTDSQLTLRLLSVEQYIRNMTNNCFVVPGVWFEGEVEGGVVKGSHQNITFGDRVEIDDGGINDGLYDVESVTDGVTKLDSPLVDGETVRVRLVKYPPDVVMGALNLVKWDEHHRHRMGLQAETLSRHTLSYDVNADTKGQGYPRSMLGFLKGHMKARF